MKNFAIDYVIPMELGIIAGVSEYSLGQWVFDTEKPPIWFLLVAILLVSLIGGFAYVPLARWLRG
jgi:hypothetical protein